MSYQELPPLPNFTQCTEDNLNEYLRPAMSSIRRPAPNDVVYNDECVLSFDTAFSKNGIYVNLKTFQSYGLQSLSHDTAVTSDLPTLYAWILKYKVPKKPTETEQDGQVEPTKMAIGVEGGFKTDDQKYEIKTSVHLVSRKNNAEAIFQYPNPNGLPSFISDVVEGVVNHVASAVKTTESTWVEEIKVSKYAEELPIGE
jgi:ubiquitin carboxyl-terminal hydrolase 5/13